MNISPEVKLKWIEEIQLFTEAILDEKEKEFRE